MKAGSLKGICKIAVGMLLAAALMMLCAFTSVPAAVSAEEGGENTITIKLNGGERLVDDARSSADVIYQVNGTSVKLTHDTVRAMFSNVSPYLYVEDSILSDATDNKGQQKFAAPLLYGLFVDADSDGELDETERLYVSGDILPVSGDMTLTCYYSNNGVQYSNATGWGDQSSYGVSLARGWEEGKIPTLKTNEVKYTYTARQLQPLYLQVVTVADQAFCCNTDEGQWCDAVISVELPRTVEVIGYQAFKGQFAMTELKGLENVYAIDAEALLNTRIERLALSNINYFAHYSMIFDSAKSSLIVEKWQNDKTPAWYANGRDVNSNPTPWFGGGPVSKDTTGFVVYVPYGKTQEWYTADPNNQLKISHGDKWNDEGGQDKAAYDASTDNLPMREFYKVSFDLNGADGYIANEYQDAGARSVMIGDKEVNLSTWNEEGTERLSTKNEAAADLSLLNVRKPADPVMEGKVFAGWKDSTGYVWKDSDFGENGKVLEGDITLTAVWEDSVTVTLDYQNGEANGQITAAAGYPIPEPETEPVKEGYVFTGWYKDAECTDDWDFETDLASEELTLYAGYTARPYSIDYVMNGGTAGAGAPTSYTIEDTVTLVAPTRAGYTFGGWFESSDFAGSAVTEIAAGSTGAKTFYAKWTAETYTITYELNGGTAGADAPTSYTVEEGVTLVAPTRTGYTFGGWFESADFAGSAVTEIAAGSTGAKTFYAKWTENDNDQDPGIDPGDKDGTGCGGSIGFASALGTGIALSAAAVVLIARKKRN